MTDREALKAKVAQGLIVRDQLIANPTLEKSQELMKIAEEVKTISYAPLDKLGNSLTNEALQYLLLQEDIKQNDGKYKCILEKDSFSDF